MQFLIHEHKNQPSLQLKTLSRSLLFLTYNKNMTLESLVYKFQPCLNGNGEIRWLDEWNDLWMLSSYMNSGRLLVTDGHTVDGRNPAPPGMYELNLVSTGINYKPQPGERRISEPSTVPIWIAWRPIHECFDYAMSYDVTSRVPSRTWGNVHVAKPSTTAIKNP